MDSEQIKAVKRMQGFIEAHLLSSEMGHPAGSLSFYEKSALKLSKTPKNASRYERQVRNGEKRSLLSRFFVGSQVLRMGKMTKNGVLTGILQIRPYIFDQISHWRTVFLQFFVEFYGALTTCPQENGLSIR